MKPRNAASATRIGAFVVGGLALVLTAIIITGGGRFFTSKERAVMHFTGSIYGLQVGAPVVFRGVRLGSVTSIGLVYDRPRDSFSIPVVVELEPRTIRGLGPRSDDVSTPALEALLSKGLKAQLAMQSLLTGQLYVDLDLRPNKPAVLKGLNPGEVEIPTEQATIQSLKSQLDGMDFRKLLDDVSTIASSARATVAGPEVKQAMNDLVDITANVKRLTGNLDQRLPPIAGAAQATFGDARRALDKLGAAAQQIDGTAQRFSATADRVNAIVADDAPLMRAVQKAADELAATAASLRQSTAEDAPLVRDTGRALHDVARAARAVRELADVLERNPQALLRGRPPANDDLRQTDAKP